MITNCRAELNQPALYEDLTRGPLAVYAKPSLPPISSQYLNFSGVTYSFTYRREQQLCKA